MSSKDGISITGISGLGEACAATPMMGARAGRKTLLTWAGYAGLWAALSSSAVFFGVGSLLDRYQSQQPVTVELNDWSWLASLNIRFDHPTESIPVGISAAPVIAAAVTPPAIAQAPALTEVVAPKIAAATRAVAKASVIHRKHSVARRHERNLETLAKVDTHAVGDVLALSMAKPVIQAPVLSEAERMQGLRMLLRGRFVAALDSPLNSQTTSLVAAAPGGSALDTVPASTPKPVVHRYHHHATAPATTVATQETRYIDAPPVTTAPVITQNKRPAAELIQEQKRLLAGLVTPVVPKTFASIETPRETAAPVLVKDTLIHVAAAPTQQMTFPPVAATAPAPTVSISIPPSMSEGTLVAQAETAPSETTTQFGYSAFPHIKISVPATSASSSVNTQATAVNSQPAAHVNHQTPVAPVPVTTVVEGFEWSTAVLTAQTEEITHERGGAPGEEISWERTTADNHWPTLTWKAGPAVSRTIPLISNNALFFLANLAQPSVKVQPGASIVFGKVASGWNVELSGRSERPIFLTVDNKQVSIGDMDGDRYFAFLNVEPGSHILYLMNRTGTAGVVAIPALSGTATYADVTQISHKSVVGKVFDAGSTQLSSLSNVQVRVVGQQTATVMSGPYGDFRLDNVTEVSNFPLYVETDADLGATHRYRVLAGQENGLALYRLRDEQVHDLIDQLEGGVSSDSGLIVAAVPQLVQSQTDGLFPSVSSLLPTPTLRPETYTMSNAGQLEVNTSLSADAMRFATVQVPDGPAIARIENKAQATVWSELVFAQARIVNLVGPY